jgi:SprT protein
MTYLNRPAERNAAYEIVTDVLDICDVSRTNLIVNVEFNNRFTRRLGDARVTQIVPGHYQGTIRLSAPLWMRATATERFETIVHECCHLVQRYTEMSQGLVRSDSHGKFWQNLMKECGVKPTRCHKVDRTGLKRTVRRVRAYCACAQGHMITKNRRTKMMRGHSYSCKRCSETITLRANRAARS